MADGATSEATEDTTTSTDTGDDTAVQQMLADAVTASAGSTTDTTTTTTTTDTTGADEKDEQLGESGKRALMAERKHRRDAEKQLADATKRLRELDDRDKTELQKAIERAEAAEKTGTSMRVANARLIAAAAHNIPAELVDLLGEGTDKQIDARAKLLAEKLTASTAAQAAADNGAVRTPAPTRPIESLTAGARPSGDASTDPNDVFRAFAQRRRS